MFRDVHRFFYDPWIIGIGTGIVLGIPSIIAFIFHLRKNHSSVALIHIKDLENLAFQMGDADASTFPYDDSVYRDQFDEAKEELEKASKGTIKGLLVVGEANIGKTRFSFETLKKTLSNWYVLKWTTDISSYKEIPLEEIAKKGKVVIFIDDLQKYIQGSIDNEVLSTGGNILNNIPGNLVSRKIGVAIIATCRKEDEQKTQIKLSKFIGYLKIIRLERIVDEYKSKNIIKRFKEKGRIKEDEWDGTLGSLVLGLKEKENLYHDLEKRNTLAAAILRAMKLLASFNIYQYTKKRLLPVVAKEFFTPKDIDTIKTNWEDAITELIDLQFVSKDSLDSQLNIRKDIYFEKVILNHADANLTSLEKEKQIQELIEIFISLKDADALAVLGEFTKTYKEAIDVYDKALALDPKNLIAYYKKSLTLSSHNKSEEALIVCDKAMDIYPNSSSLYNCKGIILEDLHEYEKSIEAYYKATEIEPNYTSAHENRGRVLAEYLNKYEDAIEEYDKGLAIDPKSTFLHTIKGEALRALKQSEAAIKEFNRAIELDPRNINARFYIGEIYFAQKHYERATEEYSKVLKIYPDHYMANQNTRLARIFAHEDAKNKKKS